jgi:HPt (histidine-containing phosphotransfer) domain-containing protein
MTMTATNANPLVPDSVPTVPSSHVDIERFRGDLREAGVEEMTEPLLTTFVSDAATRFSAFEQAVASGDAKAMASAAHAFKSGAATIRATALAEQLAEAEAAGISGKVKGMTAMVEQIRVEYLAVVRDLEALLGGVVTTTS